ncbi:MAG TPA: hypothetical protein VMT27_03465, partial [Actinomycetes bacterium]|nr:hypothetical protein [Actinomycetes bacterium]
VGTLSSLSSTDVLVTGLSAKTEPTAMLKRLRAAYTAEVSGVVISRHDGLLAVGEHDRGGLNVTDAEGRFVLHVFARRMSVQEEHVLVTWPVTPG